jgi:hypothetical protein
MDTPKRHIELPAEAPQFPFETQYQMAGWATLLRTFQKSTELAETRTIKDLNPVITALGTISLEKPNTMVKFLNDGINNRSEHHGFVTGSGIITRRFYQPPWHIDPDLRNAIDLLADNPTERARKKIARFHLDRFHDDIELLSSINAEKDFDVFWGDLTTMYSYIKRERQQAAFYIGMWDGDRYLNGQ